MTDLRKMCENPPSLPPRKFPTIQEKGAEMTDLQKCVTILHPYLLKKLSYCLGQWGKNTDLQKVCEKPPSLGPLLSRNIFLLFFVQEKGLKMTDLTPLEPERMTSIFRMTSLGINEIGRAHV